MKWDSEFATFATTQAALMMKLAQDKDCASEGAFGLATAIALYSAAIESDADYEGMWETMRKDADAKRLIIKQLGKEGAQLIASIDRALSDHGGKPGGGIRVLTTGPVDGEDGEKVESLLSAIEQLTGAKAGKPEQAPDGAIQSEIDDMLARIKKEIEK